MTTQITVPSLGESVTEATIAKWFKAVGDAVAIDEPVLELETDKVSLEVNAAAAGHLAEIRAEPGATVEVGAVLGTIEEGGAAMPAAAPPPVEAKTEAAAAAPLAPSVRRLVEENKLAPSAIPASGKDGRLIKGDVLQAIATPKPAAPPAPARPAAAAAPVRPVAAPPPPAATRPAEPRPPEPRPTAPREQRVRMTRLRKRIAERLKQAQNEAAMLTTFNEVDMTAVIALRNRHKDAFEKKHGVKLGFMSFFVKACIVGLKEIPAVNAEIDGDDIVYKNHYDIGVAVGTAAGLVVPVVRDVDLLGFSAIETRIAELGARARDGKLALEELQGGTFTISNGGVYGSLMSTPILNPPQSGILGMHKIQPRPVAIGDKVEVRPMMYLALSYDHRVIDGREAVTFLIRVKESIEDPQRLLLDL
jgi:2-oxoglutarate dehydrogenase E2 component (dihydrolipoamide succinyltransferase)